MVEFLIGYFYLHKILEIEIGKLVESARPVENLIQKKRKKIQLKKITSEGLISHRFQKKIFIFILVQATNSNIDAISVSLQDETKSNF